MSIWQCKEHGLTGPQACCQDACRVENMKFFPSGQKAKAFASDLDDIVGARLAEKEAAIKELVDALVLTRKQVKRACNNAVEILRQISPHEKWDDGDKTAEIFLSETDVIVAKYTVKER